MQLKDPVYKKVQLTYSSFPVLYFIHRKLRNVGYSTRCGGWGVLIDNTVRTVYIIYGVLVIYTLGAAPSGVARSLVLAGHLLYA